MSAIASTVPSVLIPYLAAGTERIRFGAGGVMLANHAAFSVAEQFGLLSEMFPGRIDLGLGRAPGSDGLTAAILRAGLPGDGVANYVENVELLRELLGLGSTPVGRPVKLDVGGRRYDIHATPAATVATDIWLLGSSAHSARIAARLGLPYVFANHFSIPGMAEVLKIYRDNYVPSVDFLKPQTLLPVNVVVGQTQEEADLLAGPYRLSSARLRTGGRLDAQWTVEDVEQCSWTAAERRASKLGAPHTFVGTAEGVAAGLSVLAEELGVDEVMVAPSAGSFKGEAMDRAENRERTLTSLAAALLGGAAS